MKNSLIIAIIAFHLFIVSKRLPDWRNNKSIWVAAVESDPLDPWNLNNAVNASKNTDNRSSKWLASFMTLQIPDWLPYNEREPYRVGIEGLRDSLKASEHSDIADLVNNKRNEIVIGHRIVVEYVSK